MKCANQRCGEEFQPKIKTQKYCCSDCNDQAANDKNSAIRKKKRAEQRALEEAARFKVEASEPIDKLYNWVLRRPWGV